MSRKPAHKMRHDEGREAVWELIRKLKTFCINDILYDIRLSRDSLTDYVCGLVAAGFLQKHLGVTNIPEGRRGNYYYTLIKDCGVDAPRLRKDGTVVTQGRGRQNMWNTMRVLKEFTPRDLASIASTPDVKVAESDAKHYIRYLHAAGYLIIISQGRAGVQTRYSLLSKAWTGPRPPQIQRIHQLYDPNLKQVVWGEVGGES